MPQMMPVYWFVVFFMVNLFLHIFFSFYYHNLIFFSKIPSSMIKNLLFKSSFMK